MDGNDLLKAFPLASDAVASVYALAYAAFFDKRTGLPNHAALLSLQDTYDRDVKLKWAVVFVDLSGFKEINDTYGHPTGDAALKLAGTMTESAARRHGGRAFRYGGDEFVVVVEDKSLTEFLETAEQQLSEMTLTMNKVRVEVKATLGYARGAENTTLEKLIQQADTACRIAKSRTDRRPIEWTAELADEAPLSERRRCPACNATTAVLVLPSRKTESCLKHCANCGGAF
jgi:diguanylate cyclase (GGDEF)-like protein